MTAVLLLLACLTAAAPTTRGRGKASIPKQQRETSRRAVEITDATTEVAVFVAAQSVTTLYFPQEVTGVLLPDPDGRFDGPPVARGSSLMVRAKGELPRAMAMQVTLADGTTLPPFILTSKSTSYDLFVDVGVKLQRKASGDSAVALRGQVSELQSRLDECQQSAGDQGARKVGELILRQDFSKPVAFVVEQHPTRALDKQSGLLVETRQIYRLFDLTYLVLTVENRNPDKLWVLDRAEASAVGAGSIVDAQVLDVIQEMSQGVPPGAEARLVVIFKTPEQATDQRYSLRLIEKAGNRHVALANLRL
jgi:hypothetical protein